MKLAKMVLSALVGLTVALGLAGYVVKSRAQVRDLEQRIQQLSQEQSAKVAASVAPARAASVRLPGKIEASDAVAVSPRIEAFVKELHVTEGQTVEKGALLVTLDDMEVRERLAKCEEELHAAQRHLENIERQYPERAALYARAVAEAETVYGLDVAQFSADLDDAAEAVKRADAELQQKSDTARRATHLHTSGLIPREERDVAERALRCAEADLGQARVRQDYLSEQVTLPSGERVYLRLRDAALAREARLQKAADERLTDEDLGRARAAVERCRYAQDVVRQQLDYCEMRAPIGGVVYAAAKSPRLGPKAVSPAASVSAGRIFSFEELREVGKRVMPQDILFVIEGGDGFLVRIDVDEIDLGRVRIGQEARITGVGFADRALKGLVKTISPTAEYVTKGVTTFEVVVGITGDLGNARVGMSTEVELLGEEGES